MREAIRGRVWTFGDGVNTDALYPGHALGKPVEVAAGHVLESVRPGWVGQVQKGDVIAGGRDFGIGSSRPVANLLRHLGIACLLAEEFSSLFLRNCINHGLPVLTVPGVQSTFREGDVAEIDMETGTVRNVRSDVMLSGERYPPRLLRILDAGGILPMLREDGYLVPPGGEP